jgi:hypothetical protein
VNQGFDRTPDGALREGRSAPATAAAGIVIPVRIRGRSVVVGIAAKGVDRVKLGAMPPAKAERALCDALRRGFAAHAAADPYSWSCAEGDLVVSGDVGHFSFEHAASLSNLLELVASFDDAAAKKIAWRRVSFELAHPCIDDVCLTQAAN